MTDSIHPIRLDKLFFTRSIVVAIPEHVPEAGAPPTIAPENSINIAPVEGSAGFYQVSMHTLFNKEGNPQFPYTIDVECFAIFEIDISLPDEEKSKAAIITGHSILFGAIRESVAWLTGRQPFGQLMLGLSILRPTTTANT